MESEQSNFSTNDLEQLASEVKNLESELAHLGNIMQRIDTESYGKCISCESSIQLEDLEAAPTQTFCTLHQPPNETLI